MSTERWRQVEDLFSRAIALPPGERKAFLMRETPDEGRVRADVEALLAADAEAESFLEEPAVKTGLAKIVAAAEADAAAHDDEAQPSVEEHLGPYRLLRTLGEGGMSHVYLAVRDDDQFQKEVAIKVIRKGPYSGELIERFRTERQILASLDHPYIAKILDGGTTKEHLPYFVMDYIEGVPIDVYCDQKRLDLKQRISLFLKVCSAVEYAHRNLVVHRDLKAANILVTADGEPKLLDFGIAKLLKPELFAIPLHLTSADLRPLTPFYASPEQIEGKLITTTSDVYSLGVLLYRLLTGRFPYRFLSPTLAEIERRVLQDQPEPPSSAVLKQSPPRSKDGKDGSELDQEAPDTEEIAIQRRSQPHRLSRQLAGDLDNILLMALRKEPARRYASVEQFSEDLRRFLAGEPVAAHKDSLRYRTVKFLRRNALTSSLAAALVALLIGSLVAVSIQANRAAKERDEAQRERDRAEQVVGFLQEIFQVSDPHRGGGETVTAREILDRGAQRVDKELQGQAAVQATLMETIGNVYRNLGLYDAAEPLLRRSLASRQEVLGMDHPAVAQSLNNLGVILRERGDYRSAEPLFRQALDLRRRIYKAEHPDVAQSLYNLGRLERDLGNFAAAKTHYDQAAAIYRRGGAAHADQLATVLKETGILYNELNELASAGPLFKEALALRRELHGDEHLLVAEASNDLGVFFGMQGELAQAEPLFRKALAIRERLLRPEHPDVAESLNNLARLLQEKREFAQAEALYRKSIAALRSAHDGDHPMVGVYISNLAVLLQRIGNFDEAEAYHREALAIRRRIFGDQHADVGISLKNLGSLLLERNRRGEALAELRQSVSVFEATLPDNHWRTAEAWSLLGRCLGELGRNEEGEELLLKGFQVLRIGRGLEHPRTRRALQRLVEFYETTGRVADANEFRKLLAS